MRSSTRLVATCFALALVASPVAGCGDGEPSPEAGSGTTSITPAPVIDPGDGGEYSPQLDPAEFVDVIDNPYLPMRVGSRWVYEGPSDGDIERVEVAVTGDRKEIMGISAFVVRDTVTVDGELVEDTYDWFAQDLDGNVWYLGEDVEDYENGRVVSTAGSWEAGVDGALPGIVMPGVPVAGEVFRQEFLAGEAEDMMEILAGDGEMVVPAGGHTDVVITRDWTPLEPETIEEKAYAPGVGKIREETVAGGDALVELIEFSPGG